LIAPFFDDFVLEPRANNVILNWQGKDSDQVFGPHQFSDGTLRAICLTTLLLQRLNSEELEAWLEEYSLGEIWEKNIIGGGPH
jgi:predicted ATPase